jgi:hypothetical protein
LPYKREVNGTPDEAEKRNSSYLDLTYLDLPYISDVRTVDINLITYLAGPRRRSCHLLLQKTRERGYDDDDEDRRSRRGAHIPRPPAKGFILAAEDLQAKLWKGRRPASQNRIPIQNFFTWACRLTPVPPRSGLLLTFPFASTTHQQLRGSSSSSPRELKARSTKNQGRRGERRSRRWWSRV